MPAPIAPLYIDIPGKGTARVYFEIFGDQFDVDISNVYEQLDWKPLGATAFESIDESGHYAMLGGQIDSAPKYIENILKASGVTNYPRIASDGSPTAGAALVRWFLDKPKAEVDAMLSKWRVEKLLPAIAAWATKILAPYLSDVSAPAGAYSNVAEALNGVWVGARVTIVDGQVRIGT